LNCASETTSNKCRKNYKGELKKMILTVTGLPGTNTKNLCKSLSLQMGVKYLSKEKIIKKIAPGKKEEIEANALSEEFVKKLKELVTKEGKRDHIILDWSVAAWVLNEAELKVFVLSKKKLRAMELTRTKKVPFIEAKQEIEELEEEQRRDFLHLLGVNVHDLKGFDLVINSDKLNQESISQVILKYLKNLKVK